ncbi:midkine b [Denticeps clupeoides]|nr:midkine-B-like [Denticeps clupeoides]
MRGVISIIAVLLVALGMTAGANRNKKEKGTECTEWKFGKCVPSAGDCGPGVREATCNEHTKRHKCKVPCNWKKDFGADCKYKFGRWEECDSATGTRSRSGTLKKALFNLDCQTTIKVSKPCTPKSKPKTSKKVKGVEN